MPDLFLFGMVIPTSSFNWKGYIIKLSEALGQSISINIMLCEARELTLKLRFNFLSERFLLKCTSKKNYSIINDKAFEKNIAYW